MITLTTDFPSPYPAAMKGVIASKSDARTEDIAHGLPRQDVRAAAFWLREVVPYFPPATHCVVVDPGVGTDRAAVVVEAGDHRFVAPDNGVVFPVVRRVVADSDREFRVWRYEYEDDETASNTFHGRDVFAPAAAAVHDADAVDAVERCVRTDEWTDLRFPDPEVNEQGATGEVLVVDGFGNAITNLPGVVVADRSEVVANGDEVPVRDAYADLTVGDQLVTVGSHGNVEFAVNQGRGDEAFGVGPGDTVSLRW
jgi:S-adenosylmethionine hydrolase